MTKNLKILSLLRKILILMAALSLADNLYAQNPVSTREKITIKGYSKTQTIHCNGERVVILDDYHKITITGHCSQLAVYGNKSVINLETASLISLHGDENKVTYKAHPVNKTKVSRYGDYNRVTKIE